MPQRADGFKAGNVIIQVNVICSSVLSIKALDVNVHDGKKIVFLSWSDHDF